MNDSEINARVAVIEGWRDEVRDGYGAWYSPFGTWQHMPPNYSHSWTFAGPLIEDYQLSVQCAADEAGIDWWACSLLFPHIITDRQDTPQRAICLAVIAIAEEGE